MYRGYVKLWRKLEDSAIFQNEKALKIWIWFLLRANHQEKDLLIGRKIIKIKQGEFMTSFPHLQDDLKFAMSTIHFWVNKLEELGMIESKKTNKYTLIKIKNWEDYQDIESQKKANEKAKRKLKETNNNDNNDKNDKEVITSEETSQINEVFNIFYNTINRNINFGNKTQRKAVEDMVRLQGFEKVKKVAEFACQFHGEPYMPVITTPLQLKDKWSALESWAKSKQQKDNSKGLKIGSISN